MCAGYARPRVRLRNTGRRLFRDPDVQSEPWKRDDALCASENNVKKTGRVSEVNMMGGE